MLEPGEDRNTYNSMNSIEIASQKLFFEDVLPQSDLSPATLLLVHGAGGSRLSWRRQTEDPSAKFRVIAVDLPGHGLSDGDGENNIQGYAWYVAAFMKSLDLNNVVLGGHSLGGAVALEIAMRCQDRVSALLLVGTGARLRVLPSIFSMIREDFGLAVQGMAAFLFGSDASPELIEEEKKLLEDNSADVMFKDFTACDSFDVMDGVASIRLPTLIVCGKEDRLTPPKYSEFLHERIDGSKMVFFDKCGHMPMLERSAEFNDSVSSFVLGL